MTMDHRAETRDFLYDLARQANAGPRARAVRRRPTATVRPAVQQLLDAMSSAPATSPTEPQEH